MISKMGSPKKYSRPVSQNGVARIEREQPIGLSPGVLDELRNARDTCCILFLNESTVEIIGVNNVQRLAKLADDVASAAISHAKTTVIPFVSAFGRSLGSGWCQKNAYLFIPSTVHGSPMGVCRFLSVDGAKIPQSQFETSRALWVPVMRQNYGLVRVAHPARH